MAEALKLGSDLNLLLTLFSSQRVVWDHEKV